MRDNINKYIQSLLAGVSERAIWRYKREKRSLGDDDFSSPAKRYKLSRVRIDPDDFDREAIRRIIFETYDQKENVTIKKLLV